MPGLATTFQNSADSQHLEGSASSATEVLRTHTGADFDRAYLETQIEEHQAVLTTIDDDLMPHAQSSDVKELLTEVRGRVLVHLQRAQELDAAMRK